VKIVEHEKVVEIVVRCEAEEVKVGVSVDRDGRSGVFCENFVNCFLKVCGEVWVVAGATVDVDDGVDWVGQLFCAMDLECDCGCLGNVDVVEEGDEEIRFEVHCDVLAVLVFVAFERVAVGVDGVV
jgi:hypothetical protein